MFNDFKKLPLTSLLGIALLLAVSGCGSVPIDNGVEEITTPTETETSSEPATTSTAEANQDSTPSLQDSENLRLALEAKDVAQCEAIVNSRARSTCVNSIALSLAEDSTDPAVCAPIQEETVKKACLENVDENVE